MRFCKHFLLRSLEVVNTRRIRHFINREITFYGEDRTALVNCYEDGWSCAVGCFCCSAWQMKSIFIIVLFLLDLPRNALFYEGSRGYCKML